MTPVNHAPVFATIAAATVIALAAPAQAQYMGHNLKGDFGLNSGSQPAPGVFVMVPFAQWNLDAIKDADGNQALASQFQGADLRFIPATIVGVTKRKVLGADYGFMIALPFSKLRPERVTGTVDDSEWGFTDMYVVPLRLGWHTARADFVAGYGFFAPTGRYEVGATDNVGLGMWSHEVQGGLTAFVDERKAFSVATTAFLEMHTGKKDQDLKVGNILTLEGGVAYNVPRLGGAFGLAYYLQRKLTDDTGADVPVVLLRALNLYGRNRSFGVGPEATMGLFNRGQAAGLLTVRYLWESSGLSTFEGGTFFAGFTIARLAK